MKMKRTIWFVIVCTLLASSAAAQNKCTYHTTHARYGTTCQGFVATAPGSTLAPFSLLGTCTGDANGFFKCSGTRSEEHTSELQSRLHLVCRLLLEKKKKKLVTMLS